MDEITELKDKLVKAEASKNFYEARSGALTEEVELLNKIILELTGIIKEMVVNDGH